MDCESNNNVDSDNSLTWEDFFGSSTDLTPTLIGIYDSLLEPPLKPATGSTTGAIRENGPSTRRDDTKRKMAQPISNSPSKDPRLIAGSVKLPGFPVQEESPTKEDDKCQTPQPLKNANRDTPPSKMSYVSRLKSFSLRKSNHSSSNNNGSSETVTNVNNSETYNSKVNSEPQTVNDGVGADVSGPLKSDSDRGHVLSKLNSEVLAKIESNNKKSWCDRSVGSSNSFDNLSPNVKRMLNSAGAEKSTPKSSIIPPKKHPGLATVGRASCRSKHSNIPLMGATSKITQSGVEIVSTADIYDKPMDLSSSLTKINVRSNPVSSFISPIKSNLMNRVANEWSSNSSLSSFSPEKTPRTTAASSDPEDVRGSIYDVPVSSPIIYDVPVSKPVKIMPMDEETVQACNIPLIKDKQESMDLDLGDYVYIESPERNQEKRSFSDRISPSKPAALNIALALRNITNNPQTEQSSKMSKDSEDCFKIPKLPPNVSSLFANGSAGSTGNLKQESENRLGGETVGQVPRPLSMSSIASSSSTSSSGAQNKGGINSAYLASIESLDDHSDVDKCTKFPKNQRIGKSGDSHKSRDVSDGGPADSGGVPYISVALAPTPPRPRYWDPSLTQLQRVCTEIVDTECVYVEELRQVVEGYLYPWRDGGVFSPEVLAHLFSNIEDIYHFNKTFLEHLNQCDLQAIPIARCFTTDSGGFKIYSHYCTGYPATMAALASIAREPVAAQNLRSRQAELGHPLPLGSYLLKPVQRILKYHLLLQNLVKYCTCQDTEFALHKMTGIAQHINEMKKKHEHTVRVQEIQSLLYGWSGQDLTTYGELCAEGTFRVFGAKAMRHAFLFDKMLLLTKNKEYGILAYKSHILCNNLMLVESIQGQPLSFHVIPFDNPRLQVTLQARSIQHKREWTLLLKKVILENYNAVIPSHARQLVMQLGQNKTDDDMLAEKSSALISHASMRKQLSAPEYLEKRKYERERRKSSETSLKHRIKRSTLRKGSIMDGVSENDVTDKDGSVKNDSTFEELYFCDSCSNMDISNSDLYKECQDNVICSDCKSKNHNLSSSSYNLDRCSHCDEFQSQSSINTDFSDHNKSFEKSAHFVDEKISKDTTVTTSFVGSNRCVCGRSIITGNDLIKQQLEVADVGDNKCKMRQVIEIKKTCLKCQKIRENIMVENNLDYSLDAINSKCEHDTNKIKRIVKDDPQPCLSTPKTNGSQRRKSEPGMSNINFDPNDWKKSVEDETKTYTKSQENLYYETKQEDASSVNCSNCGKIINITSKIIKPSERKCRSLDREANPVSKDKNSKCNTLEIKMYNAKTIPKKISKIKKNRAKTLRHLAVDSTAKFYTDFPTDNVLHISESTDSINTLNSKNDEEVKVNENSKMATSEIVVDKENDPMEDEEIYRNYIQKTDSFKQSEIEKDKVIKKLAEKELNKIQTSNDSFDKNEISASSSPRKADSNGEDSEGEKPLELIISQLLMQNREFQKILKKQQMRNANNRRHQRLLKSNSNPEKVLLQHKENQNNLKPKFGRQTSAVETIMQTIEDDHTLQHNEAEETKLKNKSCDEHIYETLLDAKNSVDEYKASTSATKTEDSNKSKDNESPKQDPKPNHTSLVTEKLVVPLGKQTRLSLTESDYVYLCFEGNKNVDAYKVPKIMKKVEEIEDTGEYAVPSTVVQKVTDDVEKRPKTIGDGESRLNHTSIECHYDNSSEVWKRISKDTVIQNPNLKIKRNNQELNDISIDCYLDSENGPKSPNVPEIWVQSQKEHFPTSRDKKSGSLPRSFQVNLNEFEEKVLPPVVKTKNNKIYLTKDGRVLQTDRPFTIASDHSEISYEDIERFIKSNGDSVLKFPCESSSNRSSCSFADGETIDEAIESMSKSTLELEAEIDRCYKNNLAMRREQLGELANINANFLSAPYGMDNSMSSSMEVMNEKSRTSDSQEDIISLHPEHKIYKTTMNVLSIKNVLNRFKSKSKQNQEQTVQGDKLKNGDRRKNSKRQPRNLMQRFKSIIHDEQVEQLKDETDSVNKEESAKSPVTVTVTQAEDSPTKVGDMVVSKSFCESNQDGVEPLEKVSKSCNNITFPSSENIYMNNHDLTAPLKSSHNSIKDLNKLPIYKQGSKHLGARIAQSDYADPKLLRQSNKDMDKVNVFINKNSLRPDSLLSNSSHFTSSSESNAVTQIEANKNFSFLYRDVNDKQDVIIVNKADVSKLEPKTIFDEENESFRKSLHEQQKIFMELKNNSDECYYEKSFEEIEHLLDNEIFRDSAIYSDPDDSTLYSPEISSRKSDNKNEHGWSFPSQIKESNKSEDKPKARSESRPSEGVAETNTKGNDRNTLNIYKTNVKIDSPKQSNISKMAPPIPIKPSLKPAVSNKTHISTFSHTTVSSVELTNSVTKTEVTSLKYVPRKEKGLSVSLKITEPQSTSNTITIETEQKVSETDNSQHEVSAKLSMKSPQMNSNIFQFPVVEKAKPGIPKPSFERPTSSNIKLKRLSFERCSLDSSMIARRAKSVADDKDIIKMTSDEGVVTKSVQERRKEIEMLANTNVNEKPNNRKSLDGSEHKSLMYARSVSMKMSNSSNDSSKNSLNTKVPVQKCNIPQPNSSSIKSTPNIRKDNVSNNNGAKETSTVEDDCLNGNTANAASDLRNQNLAATEANSRGGWVKQVVNRFQ